MLLDVSSSISARSLEIAKKFMNQIVEIFGVADTPDGGRI